MITARRNKEVMDEFAKGGERTVLRESLRIEGIEGKEQTNLTSNPGTGGRQVEETAERSSRKLLEISARARGLLGRAFLWFVDEPGEFPQGSGRRSQTFLREDRGPLHLSQALRQLSGPGLFGG